MTDLLLLGKKDTAWLEPIMVCCFILLWFDWDQYFVLIPELNILYELWTLYFIPRYFMQTHWSRHCFSHYHILWPLVSLIMLTLSSIWASYKFSSFDLYAHSNLLLLGISQGAWYYEVTIDDMPQDSATRIGWSQCLGKIKPTFLYFFGMKHQLHVCFRGVISRTEFKIVLVFKEIYKHLVDMTSSATLGDQKKAQSFIKVMVSITLLRATRKEMWLDSMSDSHLSTAIPSWLLPTTRTRFFVMAWRI